jgi:hypothetical protein
MQRHHAQVAGHVLVDGFVGMLSHNDSLSEMCGFCKKDYSSVDFY